MGEYKQACKFGPCLICAESGVLRGNGSAQTNPIATRSVLAYEPVGRVWDDIVRASEDVA